MQVGGSFRDFSRDTASIRLIPIAPENFYALPLTGISMEDREDSLFNGDSFSTLKALFI